MTEEQERDRGVREKEDKERQRCVRERGRLREKQERQ